MKPTDLSIILCTRNRAAALRRTLSAYKKLSSDSSWELIVVDNGSVDSTAAVIAAESALHALPLSLASEPQKGLARARNAGLRTARGAIICFSDDDCYPAAGFVDSWISLFKSTDLDFVGGRVELFDSADAPVTIKTDLQPVVFPPNTYITPGFLHGACMAFRRNVIDTIGGFDTDFGAGARFESAEDSEYFQRASEYGFSGGYRAEPAVFHHHGRKLPEVEALLRSYDLGRGAFYALLLMRRPSLMMRHIAAEIASHPSLLAYAKALYWRTYKRWFKRTQYVGVGAIAYMILAFVRLRLGNSPRKVFTEKHIEMRRPSTSTQADHPVATVRSLTLETQPVPLTSPSARVGS